MYEGNGANGEQAEPKRIFHKTVMIVAATDQYSMDAFLLKAQQQGQTN